MYLMTETNDKVCEHSNGSIDTIKYNEHWQAQQLLAFGLLYSMLLATDEYMQELNNTDNWL